MYDAIFENKKLLDGYFHLLLMYPSLFLLMNFLKTISSFLFFVFDFQDALDSGNCNRIRLLMRFLTVMVCIMLLLVSDMKFRKRLRAQE